MKSYTLEIPRRIDISCLDDYIDITKDMISVVKEKKEKYGRVIFDFTNCMYLSPTGVIYLAMLKDALNELEIDTYYKKPKRSSVHNFLSDIGLLTKKSVEHSVYIDYMITLHRCNSVNECTDVHNDIIKKAINRSEYQKGTYCALDYMLNEIWDNAGVHGYKCYNTRNYPKPVYICAFARSNEVEICISDRGQGIFSSLKNIDKYKSITRKEALKLSIENTVSGHPQKSPGFGLFCSSQFARTGDGELVIWSSETKLSVSSKCDKIYSSRFNMGTLISIIIPKNADIPFGEILCNDTYGQRDEDEYIEEMIDGVFYE